MVVSSLVIFILKEVTSICSLPLSVDRFIQTAWKTHCFNILAIKVKKKRENSVPNHYLTEVWGTNMRNIYKIVYTNKFKTDKEGKIYINCRFIQA